MRDFGHLVAAKEQRVLTFIRKKRNKMIINALVHRLVFFELKTGTSNWDTLFICIYSDGHRQ